MKEIPDMIQRSITNILGKEFNTDIFECDANMTFVEQYEIQHEMNPFEFNRVPIF